MARPAGNKNTDNENNPAYMTPGNVNVLPEAGWARSITGLDFQVAPQVVAGGQSAYATYTLTKSGLAVPAGSHLLVVEAPAANSVRILRVCILAPGTQTTAGVRVLQLVRTTSAGVGNVVVPAQHDSADTAYAGICRSQPTQGAAGAVIQEIPVFVPTAVGAFAPIVFDYGSPTQVKAPVIPAGVANGIVIYDPGAAGAAGFSASITFALVV